MPKKFTSENTKAVVAKARKAAAREEQESKKKQAIEEEFWKDDDKHIQRKLQRKDEKDRKKQELLDKKAQNKALLEKELGDIKPTTKPSISKITRAQIQEENEKRQHSATAASQGLSSKSKIEPILPLEENINRIQVEGVEARTITEAIEVLSLKETPADRHPERRMKAAFAAFQEKMLVTLKEENPTLRLSQLKQLVKQEWNKSPENPFNQ